MRAFTSFLSLIFSLVLLLAVACQSNNKIEDGAADAVSEAETPADNTEKRAVSANAIDVEILKAQLTDSVRADPARMYAALCARCHGLDGVPVFPGAPNLKELTCPKRAITGTIFSGRGQMPSFAEVLSRPEIGRLADYVRSMQENPE